MRITKKLSKITSWKSMMLILSVLFAITIIVTIKHEIAQRRLMDGLISNDYQKVKSALANGANPNANFMYSEEIFADPKEFFSPKKDPIIVNATINAYESRETRILEALLQHGADPNVYDWWGNSPLSINEEHPTNMAPIIVPLLLRYKAIPHRNEDFKKIENLHLKYP